MAYGSTSGPSSQYADWQLVALTDGRQLLQKVIANVTVINRGRAAVNIVEVEVYLRPSPGKGLRATGISLEDDNIRLEPASSNKHVFDVSSLGDRLEGAQADSTRVGAAVHLGNGLIVHGKTLPYSELADFRRMAKEFGTESDGDLVAKHNESTQ
jgi:hypothetical protein